MKELYSTPLPPTLHCAPSEPKAENRGGHCCRLHHTTVKALGGWLTVGLFPRLQVSAVVWKVSFNVQSLRWETPSAFHFPGEGHCDSFQQQLFLSAGHATYFFSCGHHLLILSPADPSLGTLFVLLDSLDSVSLSLVFLSWNYLPLHGLFAFLVVSLKNKDLGRNVWRAENTGSCRSCCPTIK